MKFLERVAQPPAAAAGAGGSRTLDGRANREGERWPGRGFPGDAQLDHRACARSIIRRTIRFIKRRCGFRRLFVDDPEDFRIQPCLSPVWDTAINIIALAESGFPAQHPGAAKSRAMAGRQGGASSRRLDGQQPASGSERLGLRIQQRFLSRHGRHRDGADGVAPGSA